MKAKELESLSKRSWMQGHDTTPPDGGGPLQVEAGLKSRTADLPTPTDTIMRNISRLFAREMAIEFCPGFRQTRLNLLYRVTSSIVIDSLLRNARGAVRPPWTLTQITVPVIAMIEIMAAVTSLNSVCSIIVVTTCDKRPSLALSMDPSLSQPHCEH